MKAAPSACLSLGLLLLAFPAQSRIWRVPADAPTIEAALDSALAGDVVQPACGTYREHDLALKPGVTLRSETGLPDCVVIDGQGLGRIALCNQPGEAARLEGLTLTHGNAEASVGRRGLGGGLFVRYNPVVIERCDFVANIAGVGGGMIALECAPALRGCAFRGNEGTSEGGALELGDADVVVADCVFSDNHANSYGGAVGCYQWSTASFARCLFEGNSVLEEGGALDLVYGTVSYAACRFTGNRTGWYGTLNLIQGTVDLVDCTVSGNVSEGTVSGLRVINASRLTAVNTDVRDNRCEADCARPDGWVGPYAAATLTCCDVDTTRWDVEGALTIDNDDCAVPAERRSLGNLKSRYR